MISAVNEFLDDLRGGRMTEAPVVTVEQGQLQGRVAASPSGKAYYSFQGIPYAKPPLGSLRFKAPQPAESWDGIRDATSEGNVGPQVDPLIHKGYVGDENCLYLNVYTPNLDGAFLPVMIYIHGGGFKNGSGSSSLYGGDFLVEKDVVVVTINYRLGALGFLALNTPEVPGNAGLKDIVQAIRWVKDNIHNFGGNSGNLTLFGESAGGMATSVLTASPLTKNLISKAIIQSGTALSSMAYQKNPIENARQLVKALGSDAEDVDEILDFLTATPAKEIVEATEKLYPLENLLENISLGFDIIVEKEFPDVEAVLTESFYELLVSGRVAEIPIMIGSTTLELTLVMKSDDIQDFIPQELHVERNSDEALQITNEIKRLYFKGSHTGVESLKEYFELLSDKLLNVDTHRYVKYLVQVSKKPIYYYKFDYVGELNLSKKLYPSLGLNHAGHMDELGYLFSNDLLKDVEPTTQDVKMRERMLRLWTNFAKSGNPTPDENHYITVTWLPVTHDNLYFINLGNELSLGSNPDKEKMEFWDSLYTKYYRIWEHPKTNTEEVVRKHEPIIVAEQIQTPEAPQQEIIVETTVESVEVVDNVKEDTPEPEPVPEIEPTPVNFVEIAEETPEPQVETVSNAPAEVIEPVKEAQFNGNGNVAKPRTSNEIKMVQNANGVPKDVIRANDPPEDDLPKNIGVNKFVNFFESLGGKK
ncbi:juvenile hormone esterase-like isoform X2 [Ostrinia nubilalis]|uniref:juvenile hormone esterase-like isoform X2 n=2 Tax=Ostrinia nubilalis TaxID=29057 RepID=UPI0030823B03